MKVRMVAAALTLAFGAAVAGMAQAGKPTGGAIPSPISGYDCSSSSAGGTLTGETSCMGFYEGNLDGGSPADLSTDAAILSNFGLKNVTSLGATENVSGNTIDFTSAIYGTAIISIHVGASDVGNDPKGGTAFYEISVPKGTTSITFKGGAAGALSNAVLWSTTAPVPEAAGWAFAIAGVGAIGFAARRRRATHVLAA